MYHVYRSSQFLFSFSSEKSSPTYCSVGPRSASPPNQQVRARPTRSSRIPLPVSSSSCPSPPILTQRRREGSGRTRRCRRRRRRCLSGGRRGWPTSATPTSAPRWCETASRSPSSPRPLPARRSTSPPPIGRTASRRSPVSALLPTPLPIRSFPASFVGFF
jgi:hypothetical protein